MQISPEEPDVTEEEQELARNLQGPCGELYGALKNWNSIGDLQTSHAIDLAQGPIVDTLMRFHIDHPNAVYYSGTSTILSEQMANLGLDTDNDEEWIRVNLDIAQRLAEGFRKRIEVLLNERSR